MFNVKKLAFGAAMLAASAVCFAAPKVEIVTSEGNIVVNLNEKAAPTTVANFVKYAKEGFYNGTIFHRVINNFMIQGGGFDRNLHQKSTHAPIKLEDKNGLKNTVGTIAMARTNNPDSATSQFFINLKTTTSLTAHPPRTVTLFSVKSSPVWMSFARSAVLRQDPRVSWMMSRFVPSSSNPSKF